MDRLVKSLALFTANAAFSLSYSEMWNAYDGSYRGKEPQLWSCTAFLMEIYQGLLGAQSHVNGLLLEPSLPEVLASGVAVQRYPYRNARLNIALSGRGRGIESFTVNGKPALNLIAPDLSGELSIQVKLTDKLPFGFAKLPTSIGYQPGAKTTIAVETHRPVADLTLLVLHAGHDKPSEFPVVNGKAEVDFSPLLPYGSGEVHVALISRDSETTSWQMTHWHPILIRPALAAHWVPGLIEFTRPVAAGTLRKLDLVISNLGDKPQDFSLKLPSAEGFEFRSSQEVRSLAPGETVALPVTFASTSHLGYGKHDMAATFSYAGLHVQAPLTVRIEESIDLRGSWNAKELPEGESGASFNVNDRDGMWSYVDLPARWKNLKGFENTDGPIWFRKHVLIPAAWKKHELELFFGEISGKPSVYFNEKLLEPGEANRGLRYRISPDSVRPGDNNLIAVRVEVSSPDQPKTGLTGWPMELRVLPLPSR